MVVTPTPGENSLGEPAPPAGAEHELGGVDAAGEVEQRVGDVVADDLVVGAAEVSTSTRCRARCAGSAPASPSLRATCTASRSAPLVRAAIRAARRIRVSPSGPPVSATTTRSRASQVAPMSCSARYRSSCSSTLSASQSSASSRSAVRLPTRK